LIIPRGPRMKDESRSAGSPAVEKYIIFDVEGRMYALPLERVTSVSHIPEITPIPDSSRTVAGVINHRGDIVAVLDLSRVLGGKGRDGKGSNMLLYEHEGETLGLVVDSISDIREVDAECILEPSAHLASELGSHVIGFIGNDEHPIIILDLERKIEELVYDRRANDIKEKE